jgi:DNA-cytosine methyltransferase
MSASCDGLPLDPIFFSEIEPFPCAVLKSHFPTIPNLGDMSKIRRDENGNITNGIVTIPFPNGGIDILAAGCPCQDFSIAGKRAGGEENSGTRSSLVFEFIRIINEIRPRYFIYENVPGMFTSNKGRDFAHILMALRDCGYGCAWRVLDAQYVRVDRMERAIPQRRRRVWVVGCAGGDVTTAAQILFEPKGIAGDTPPRRRTGQEIAAASRGRNRVHGGLVGEAPRACGFIPYGTRLGADANGIAKTIAHIDYKFPQCVALDGDKLKPRTDQRKGGNNLPITCFAKVAHPTGKNGEGERWAGSEVVGTRNVFDISETRTQECVVIEKKEAK